MKSEEPKLDEEAGERTALLSGGITGFACCSYVRRLERHFGWRLLILLCAAQHLMKGFANTLVGKAVPYLFRSYGIAAPQVQVFNGIIGLPWAMKPVVGLSSDVVPILGRHKAPYILGTSLCSCFAFLVVSCWSSSTVSEEVSEVAVVCLVLIMLQFSTCDLLTEARYAAKMQLAPEAGPDLLSFVWAGINGAAFLAMLASGPMLHDWGPRLALLAAAVPAGMVLVPVLLGCLEERKVSQEELHAIRQRYFEQRETCFLCMLMLAGALAIMMTGLLQHDPVVNFAVSLFTALFILLCFSVCLTPTIARANAFAVLYTGLSASISGASFYFYTDSPDIYPAGPHFSDFFYNTVLGAVGTVVSLLGIYLYQQYLSDLTYRQLIVVTSLAMFAFSLLDVMMFARLNVRMGIPDHWLVLGLSVCEQIIWQWQWMPQVVLLAALCPAGMEATMLALLAGCHNLGNTLGSNFGAVLLHLLEVRPRGRVGDAAELENLWIAAGVSSVLPLFTAIFLRFLLPDCKQNAKITTVADPTHNSLLRRWLHS